MKRFPLITFVGLMIAACAQGESAHKGWSAVAARWSCDPPSDPVVRDVGMTGPCAGIKQPDPPANGIFHAGYSYRKGSTVTVQRVYMLEHSTDAAIKTKEITITPLSLFEKEVITDYYCAEFKTEKVSFKEGDVFVVVLKVNGQLTPVFLKIMYSPFIPS
jgi:hypothetical protein